MEIFSFLIVWSFQTGPLKLVIFILVVEVHLSTLKQIAKFA